MEVSGSFELVVGKDNGFLFADVVQLSRDSPKRQTPKHFHPQIELVWFRKVTGSVSFDGVQYPLHDGQIVLLPSMHVHSFETFAGQRDWILLQFEPFLMEALLPHSALLTISRPMILTPDPETSKRIDFLCDWLHSLSQLPDRALEAQHVLSLLLISISAPTAGKALDLAGVSALSGPLQEVLRQIHSDPQNSLPLSKAARTARVSGAHFSRSFKSRMGMSYTAYVQMHRLNVAASALVTDRLPVSQIAYRVGFTSAAHFSTVFAKRFGLSPRAFRQRAAGKLSADHVNERN